MRESRKIDHLNLALQSQAGKNGFEDIFMIYQAISELALENIDTSTNFLGKKLKAPVLINAMTGGHPDVKEINKSLANVAAKNGIAMAVGSQQAGLENLNVIDTYSIVREVNPNGVILANVNASVTPENVNKVVDMIGADGVQLHLNIAHELAMTEGDRNFKGIMINIENVVLNCKVPVVVKEVGYGLAKETIPILYQAGVRNIDISGHGGTDFVIIEELRANKKDGKFSKMGIPTAISLLETLSLELPLFIIASGGISSALQITSALALGAGLVGMAGNILRVLMKESEQALDKWIKDLIQDLQRNMLMIGSKNVHELISKPVVITGFTAEWLTRRGIEINKYARR